MIGNRDFFQPVTSRFDDIKLVTRLAMITRGKYTPEEEDTLERKNVNSYLAMYWNDSVTHEAAKQMVLELLDQLKEQQTDIRLEKDDLYKRC